jgi:iron-sulfur cluster repair protein YtfE (RIC family)
MDILSVSIRNDISSNGYQLEYCCGISPMVNQVSVYCRSGSELEIRLTKLQQQHPTAIWLTSDLTALVKTALETGFQLTQMPLIDLTAEAKMLMLTHPKYQSADLSIENAYHVFNVKLETSHSHRQTILFKRVLDLLNATLQDSIRTNAIIQQMVIRGEYIKAIVKLDKQGAGFPIDQDKLNDWFVNQADTIDKIQQKVNDVYGEIYVTTSDNKGRKLSHERLKLLANINNIPWQTWGNGSYLNLDKSYLTRQDHYKLNL